MTAVLERLLGRLPIGWLQLTHNRTRLLAALAGVAFANLLVFTQLGFMGAMIRSIQLSYDQMAADILISSSDANTLSDGGPLPRQRMFEALTVPGVATATPLLQGKVDWKQPDGTIRTLDVFGIDPGARVFRSAEIDRMRQLLALPDVALIDRGTRNVPREVFQRIDAGAPLRLELRGRTLEVAGVFRMGGGFSADGYMVVSDQTFLRLFPQRQPGAPNHILVTVEPSAKPEEVARRLSAVLPAYDAQVRTIAAAVAKDQAFQTTQRPIGVVFGLGIAIGVLVGVVIVYQVLVSDVTDHLKEYATLKAVGYRQGFFLGIVFEEALILSLLGFVPGLLAALGLYAVTATLTGLPIAMTQERALAVLLGSIAMCVISGAIATRRLARANPADLF